MRRWLYSLYYRLWGVHYSRYMVGKSIMADMERRILYGDPDIREPVGILFTGTDS